MNPDMRAYMPYHYGTGYMPYPYGTHMGYGYPPYGIEYMTYPMTMSYPMAGPEFAVPLRAPVR